MRAATALLILFAGTGPAVSQVPQQERPRARDAGVVVGIFPPGTNNAITDVAGVRVTGAHVRCLGKGRKQRATPLTSKTVAVLRVWLEERGGAAGDPLYPTRTGTALSRDALEHRITKHTATAAKRCPSLSGKRVTAHVLRHTAAMRLLEAGVDTSVIALWLGHEKVDTTQVYLHAHLALKEQALARTKPLDVKPGRYRPPDPILAFLEAL